MPGQFPIAEQIRQGHPVVTPTWWPKDDFIFESMNWNKICTDPDVSFFDISVASDLYWCGQKSFYDLEHDFGPLRPPYPAMWMEFRIPAEAVGLSEMEQDCDWLVGTRHAVFLYTQEYRHNGLHSERVREAVQYFDDADMIAICGHLLSQVRGDDRIMYVPVVTQLAVDRHTGYYVPETHGGVADQESLDQLRKRVKPEIVEGITKVDLNAGFMALNLMNCRNVTTRERGPAFTRSGREKRQGVPGVRFHTIQLPGMSARYVHGRRMSREDARTMAAHRVRGHFKTYTAEAPLLGKHVGTYWWGWNVRGNPSHGEVVSDYKFREA